MYPFLFIFILLFLLTFLTVKREEKRDAEILFSRKKQLILAGFIKISPF